MVGTGAMKEEDVAADEKTEKENAHSAKRKGEDDVEIAQRRTGEDKKEEREDGQTKVHVTSQRIPGLLKLPNLFWDAFHPGLNITKLK
jgi:hypothetical protein